MFTDIAANLVIDLVKLVFSLVHGFAGAVPRLARSVSHAAACVAGTMVGQRSNIGKQLVYIFSKGGEVFVPFWAMIDFLILMPPRGERRPALGLQVQLGGVVALVLRVFRGVLNIVRSVLRSVLNVLSGFLKVSPKLFHGFVFFGLAGPEGGGGGQD